MSGRSLWRGGKLLGRIEPFADGPPFPDLQASGMILGVLQPTSAFAGTKPVSQSQDVLGRGATQQPMETIEVNTDPKPPIEPIGLPPDLPPDWKPPEGPEVEMQLPPLEGAVPYSETLEIRTDDGTIVDCWNIAIMHMVPRADYSDYDWQREFGTEREAWVVSAFVSEPL